MGKLIDLTSQTFGKLTVIEKTDKKSSNGHIIWKCKCECGNETEVTGDHLKSGHTKSCGCLRALENLTGQRFGKLIVLDRVGTKNKNTTWLCQCDCGNKVIVRKDHLKSGNTQSCGCLNQEKVVNLLGQKFGKLLIIERAGSTPDRKALWKCQCDYGNVVIKSGDALRNNNTALSCGCSKVFSKGEFKIIQILTVNNISFEQQKSFENCKDNRLLPFDFYVDNKYIIEYDGVQHFESQEYFGGEEGLKITQEHDKIKNQYCLDNNIPIIRIPYTHYDNLCLEDLMPETSKFLIN